MRRWEEKMRKKEGGEDSLIKAIMKKEVYEESHPDLITPVRVV